MKFPNVGAKTCVRALAGAVLVLVLVLLAPAWGAPPPDDDKGGKRSPARSTTDGILDSALESDRAFKGGGHGEHGPRVGHLPASRRNVELVGKLRVGNAARGRIADVDSLGNFAYLGAFSEPDCKGGVYVVDISNPRAPEEAGFIPTSAGSYVSEGVQALRLDTPSFKGDLLVHNNEECGGPGAGLGGMSLWDVSDPRKPVALAKHAGDPTVTPPANAIHSVFAWQQGERAFAVQVDDLELDDVDIFEITDPRQPRQIAEVGLPDWPQAQNSQSEGIGDFASSFLHDVQVKKIGGNWRMLLSYWDAGYITLDVNDPAKPRFIEDSDFPDPDPLTGFAPPEGDAHYAEWDRTDRFILAADEDFQPFRLGGRITSGPFIGGRFEAPPAVGSPRVDADRPLIGPTTFVGRACSVVSVPVAPSKDSVAVIERGGGCTFTEKSENVAAKGYQAGVVFNDQGNDPNARDCEATLPVAADGAIPFLGVVPRSVGYKILGVPGYDPADCPDKDSSQPPLPAVGRQGSNIDVRKTFEGWGYMRLLDADTLAEIDSYAVPEGLDERYADGFGDLSIHETAADPTHDIAYASWYSAGLRVMSFGPAGLEEVGHYVDEGGSNFWGVEVHTTPAGERLVLASDRDSGLSIFRYGADLAVSNRAGRARVRAGRTITYTQRVSNRGPSAGRNVRLADRLGPDVSLVSATASQGRCAAGTTVTCELGTLPTGASAAVTVVVRTRSAGTVQNTATATSDDPDPDARNDSAAKVVRTVKRCVYFRSGVRGKRLGARLGQRRSTNRRRFKGSRLRVRRGMDRYCIAGGGSMRIAYPTKRLSRALRRGERRRIRGRAVLILTTTKRYRIKRIGRGTSTRALRRRLRGERRVRVGRNVWYLAGGRESRRAFKTRGGRVLELGLADKRLTRSRGGARRLLRASGGPG